MSNAQEPLRTYTEGENKAWEAGYRSGSAADPDDAELRAENEGLIAGRPGESREQMIDRLAREVTVRLMRSPETVRTLLAGFRSTDDAGAALSPTPPDTAEQDYCAEGRLGPAIPPDNSVKWGRYAGQERQR